MEQALEALREIHRVQGNEGNWNHDSYMHGMFNGLEFALSLFENRMPDFRIAPEVWLESLSTDKPVKASESYA